MHVVSGDEVQATLAAVTAEHERAGRKVYVVPVGGSNPIGALGYVAAFDEIAAQARALDVKIDAIVHAASSGGTQAGLIAGAAMADSAIRIMGVNVAKNSGADVAGTVHALALDTMQLLGGDLNAVTRRLHVIDGYQGAAYGVPSDAMREALSLVAQSEGLLLDPVYTGKAMAGLIGHVITGKFTRDQTVVFLHTGGAAVLSAYVDELTSAPSN